MKVLYIMYIMILINAVPSLLAVGASKTGVTTKDPAWLMTGTRTGCQTPPPLAPVESGGPCETAISISVIYFTDFAKLSGRRSLDVSVNKGAITNQQFSEPLNIDGLDVDTKAPLIREIEAEDCSSCLARIICFACYLSSQHDMPASWSNLQPQSHV